MAVKYFDINRLARFEAGFDCVRLTPEDIVGLSMDGNYVRGIYTVGGNVDVDPIHIDEFTKEIERAVKQTMADQNEALTDFKHTLAEKVKEAKEKAMFEPNTDKIADYN